MSPSPEGWGGHGAELKVLGTYDARNLDVSEEDQADQHYLGFSRALEDARLQMKANPAWHGKTVRLRMEVWLTDNPGSVGEYRVWGTHP